MKAVKNSGEDAVASGWPNPGLEDNEMGQRQGARVGEKTILNVCHAHEEHRF